MGRIKQLVKLMKDNDLSEIDLEWEKSRIRLRRGATMIASAPVPTYAPPPAAAPAASSSEAPAGKPPAASGLLEIKSPMVGTFYSASSPDVDPFVKVGSRVAADTAVCNRVSPGSSARSPSRMAPRSNMVRSSSASIPTDKSIRSAWTLIGVINAGDVHLKNYWLSQK
jgi:acetyl-CoA carboxylase biotin carboxyl carrier protein